VKTKTLSHVVVDRTDHADTSVFVAENLLREARRQRGLAPGEVPSICVLDPDGDIVRYLNRSGRGKRSDIWACYHTEMWTTTIDGIPLGVVGCAVGAPFAVLVAEQCFASGARLVVSVTSAGQIALEIEPPCFILIDRALRGDGTSHCYVPVAPDVSADPVLIERAERALATSDLPLRTGTTWTTDAPFRETEQSIAIAREAGALAVEMEASALYALSQAKGLPIVCLAHVTNQMAQIDGDFEKGLDDGAHDALHLVVTIALDFLSA